MKIKVVAKPASRVEKIEKRSEGEFEVWVKDPPVKGLANAAIARVLADYFNVPKYNIRLVSGFSSRYKVFEIS